mgnify:CR=1 FL=1
MTTYITNIGLLATPRGDSARRGRQQGEITLLRDAWVAVEGGKIAAVGQGQPAPEDGDILLDAGGRLMTPGLVDAHPHLIFGGWRQNELGQKLRGVPYLDILAQGGGILSTVRATRAVYDRIRQAIPPVDQDVVMHPLMVQADELVKAHAISWAAEAVCGELK